MTSVVLNFNILKYSMIELVLLHCAFLYQKNA